MLREPPIDTLGLNFSKYDRAKYELYWNSTLKYKVFTSLYSEEEMVSEILSRFPLKKQVILVVILKTDKSGKTEIYRKKTNPSKSVVVVKELVIYRSAISAAKHTNVPYNTIKNHCAYINYRKEDKSIPVRFLYETTFKKLMPDDVINLQKFNE